MPELGSARPPGCWGRTDSREQKEETGEEAAAAVGQAGVVGTGESGWGGDGIRAVTGCAGEWTVQVGRGVGRKAHPNVSE